MTKLVFMRHGQSEWNLQNRFTGWVDVKLTDKGRAEAVKAGQLLGDTGIAFDACYTSVLTRAIVTLNTALEEMGASYLPVTKDYRLNERHYGGLTGLDKQETRDKHGDDQVHIWRRSYDTPPPVLDDLSQFPSMVDARYNGIDVPHTESLKLTLDRVQPYWEAEIAPRLKSGDNLILAAHGNSIRAIVKLLFNVPDDQITQIEIPTGNPLLIDLEDGTLNPISAKYLDADRANDLPKIG